MIFRCYEVPGIIVEVYPPFPVCKPAEGTGTLASEEGARVRSGARGDQECPRTGPLFLGFVHSVPVVPGGRSKRGGYGLGRSSLQLLAVECGNPLLTPGR